MQGLVGKEGNRQKWIFGVIMLMAILSDQISKVVARAQISPKEWIEVLGPLFSWTNVENTGAFLGMGSDLPAWLHQLFMLYMPSVVLVLALLYGLYGKDLIRRQRWALALLVGGGFGNLVDRFRFGSVTDFMHMDFGIAQTGIFNVADLCITGGLILMLVSGWRSKKQDGAEVQLSEQNRQPLQSE